MFRPRPKGKLNFPECKSKEVSKKLRIALDIDNTIATGEAVSSEVEAKKYLDEFKRHGITEHIISISTQDAKGKPAILIHILHRGAIEFAKWLHYTLDSRISFFSAGAKERNVPFAKEYLSSALGEEEYGRIQDTITVCSREDLNKSDTSDEDSRLQQIKYEKYGLGSGNFHKDLTKALRKGEDIKDIVLVDDDETYICPGQVKNSLIAGGTYRVGDFNLGDANSLSNLLRLNNIFYITGMLKSALDLIPKEGSFLNGLFKLQYKPKHPFTYERLWSISDEQLDYYLKGLKVLQKINPGLDFYGAEQLKFYFDAIEKGKTNVVKDHHRMSLVK